MAAMQALRNASFLARLVLAWFALAIGVAVASPIVKPKSMELLCSGGVMKLLVTGEDGSTPATGHTLDCPLCVALDAPPASSAGLGQAQPDSAGMLASHVAAPVKVFTAAPPPARGPPLFSA
jgi:hypothetical protein